MRQMVDARQATGRNAPCPCGSGKKYKLCCAKPQATSRPVAAAPTIQQAHDLHRQGAAGAALALYEQVLSAEPAHPRALMLAGIAALQLGRHERAVVHLTRAVGLPGAPADAYRNLAVALHALGNQQEAIARLHDALRLEPRDAITLQLLGEIQHQYGDLDAAIGAYQAALRLNPRDGVAMRDLGNVFATSGDQARAVAYYRQALPLIPDNPDLYNNLGMALAALGRLTEARDAYEQGARLFPDSAVLTMNLAGIRGELNDWEGLPDLWSRLKRAASTKPDELINPFYFLTIPSSGAEQLACARNWARGRFSLLAGEGARLGFRHHRGPRERLHVGYLSADFHDHATALLLAEILERHDQRRFRISAYSFGPDDGGEMRKRIGRAVDQFVDLATLPHVEAARRIHADGVDVLIDLKGYTRGARTEILALRPAPVQVNFLGYPGTMGAPFIDYIVTDRFLTPPERAGDFAERLAYLPHSYQPNDRSRPIATRTPTRAECDLPDGAFVFCCFNQEYKITAEVFAIWLRLLATVPGSVLWLLQTNRWATDNLRGAARRHGIDPERLIFAPRLPVAEHLARHRLADLFLDTLQYNAHTTASDALWAGLPLVTCAGETFVARVAGSLLHAVGLPELVTTSPAEYEALALALARDPDRLAALRARLAANREVAPLFDSARYTRDLEVLLWRMWELAGEEGPIYVDDRGQAPPASGGASAEHMLRTALALHHDGRLREAATLYELVLAADPGNADALHLLGVAAAQVGDHGRAIELLGRALLRTDAEPALFKDLALALYQAGDAQAAAGCLQEGLQRHPGEPTLRAMLADLATA